MLQQIFSRQLRFTQNNGQAYPDWEVKSLEDVALKKSSTIAANAIKSKVGKYAIYGASGLLKHIDFFQEEQAYIGIVKDGAGVGRAFLCEAKSSVLGTLDIIKAKTAVNILFLYYVLGQIQFKKYIVGSTIPHIYFNSYKTQKLLLPSLPEQQKIGNFLSGIDQKITNLSKQLTLWQQYKKGLLQQIFSRQLRFTQNNGQAYPDWEVKRLKELLIYEQPTKYIVSSTEYDDAYTIPVLTAGKTFILGYTNETDGICTSPYPIIIFDDFTTANKYVTFKFKVKSSAMKLLHPISSHINMKFIFEAMQMIRFRLLDHKRYWIAEYQYLKIPFPSLPEQQKIGNFLSGIDTKITNTRQRLTQMQAFKKGLLQQLFV